VFILSVSLFVEKLISKGLIQLHPAGKYHYATGGYIRDNFEKVVLPKTGK